MRTPLSTIKTGTLVSQKSLRVSLTHSDNFEDRPVPSSRTVVPKRDARGLTVDAGAETCRRFPFYCPFRRGLTDRLGSRVVSRDGIGESDSLIES